MRTNIDERIMNGKEVLERLEDNGKDYLLSVRNFRIIKQDLERLEQIKLIFEDMKDARDNASFLQDDEEYLTIFNELSHWCKQLGEVLENE